MLKFLGERALVVFGIYSTYLVFNDDGVELLIAKVPIKTGISWDSLSHDHMVFGNTVLEIDGCYYTIGLLRGGNSHRTIAAVFYGFNTTEHQGSEWNRLIYPIHSTVHTSSNIRNTSDMGTLAQYSDVDLLIHTDYSNGMCNWCQEVSGVSSAAHVHRGGYGVTYSAYTVSYNNSTINGWRPILTKLNIGALGEL